MGKAAFFGIAAGIGSGFVAVIFTPLLGSVILVAPRQKSEDNPGRIYRLYRSFLIFAMRAKWLTILVSLTLFIASLLALPLIPRQFFPSSDRPELLVDLSLPQNASIHASETAAKRLDAKLAGDPDVLFLSEAFTKPAMMHALGKAGFQQSYTYFTWRNEKWEIEEYMKELTTETDSYFRPSFWVNTPDILPSFLQWGGKPAFTIRAVLAATLSPLMGVYSGYELFENAALGQGREEYLDSEKFQYRPRDWAAAEASGENLNLLLGTLNAIRRQHPALQQLRNLHFHHAPHSEVIVYSKRAPSATPGEPDDLVLCVVSLDPLRVVESEVYLAMDALGLGAADVFLVHDELTGQTWRWGQRAFVRLTVDDPAHVLTLIRYGAPPRASEPVTPLLSPGSRLNGWPLSTVARLIAGKVSPSSKKPDPACHSAVSVANVENATLKLKPCSRSARS